MTDNYLVPLMRKLIVEPEDAHTLSIIFTALGIAPKDTESDDLILNQRIFGHNFSNPIGLAAGYDKNAEACGGLLDLGFSFVEIGTVTPEAQTGEERPRMYRLPADLGIINRYGFNSEGVESVRRNLETFRVSRSTNRQGIIGVNAGKNKITEESRAADDYVRVFDKLGSFADYLVVNVSSPNTPGLRDMQRRDVLSVLLRRCREARDAECLRRGIPSEHLPLMVKIAPDLTAEQRQEIAEVVLSERVDGLIVSNTTLSRPASLSSTRKGERGGLSGQPVRALSTALVRDMFLRTKGQVKIVGVGGVANGRDALEKIKAGASLVQMYSMLAYEGPGAVRRTKRELANLLRAEGFASVSDAVGCDARRS